MLRTHRVLVPVLLFFAASALRSADLIISNGNSVSLSAGTFSYDTLRVETGGTLVINGAVEIDAASLELQSGGKIDGKGRGYGADSGPGAGSSNQYFSGSGGGHAGSGGSGEGGGGSKAGGGAYDTLTAPVQPGSGGGTGKGIYDSPGGAGGAALHLVLSGAALVNGSIDMSGANGGDQLWSGGGGAGGALWIEATAFSGSGSLSVAGGVGGNAYDTGFGGGGGSGGLLRVDPAGNCTAGSLAIGYPAVNGGSAGISGGGGHPGNGSNGQGYDSCPAFITVFDAPDVTEGDSGTQAAVFSLKLSKASGSTVTVDWHTYDISATAGTDYTALSGTSSFAPGETAQNVTVTVLSDTKNEATEDFGLSLTASTGAGTMPRAVRAVIVDNDPLPTLTLNAGSYGANEDAGGITITVNLSAASGRNVSVNYNSLSASAHPLSGYAADSSDYITQNGTLVIPAGSTSASIFVGYRPDSVYEFDESFRFRLSSPVNATLGSTAAVDCDIYNDDAQPAWKVVRASDNGPLEFTEGGTDTFLIELGYPAPAQLQFYPYTTDGSAVNGQDYNGRSGDTFPIPHGSHNYWFDPRITDDDIDEGDESFDLQVYNGEDGSDHTYTVTIHDNDHSLITGLDRGVAEGLSGTTDLLVNLTLTHPNTRTVTVDYRLVSGSAQAGTDFVALSGTASFSPLQTSLTLTVQVLGDALPEGDEDFYLALSGPAQAGLARDSIRLRILEDDGATPTPTPSPSPTPAISPTATPTFTPTPTPNLSLTPTFTPTVTPVVTTASGPADAVLGPMPARRGQPLCLHLERAPASTAWTLYNGGGQRAASLDFGADPSPCAATDAWAPGIYWARIRVRYQDGSEQTVRRKLLVIP